MKKKGVVKFPFCVHLVSWEKENVSRKALEGLFSVRCKYNHGTHAQEALCRAKFKFSSCQKIIVSRKWGFTKFNRADYTKLRQSTRILTDGVNAKVEKRLLCLLLTFSYK